MSAVWVSKLVILYAYADFNGEGSQGLTVLKKPDLNFWLLLDTWILLETDDSLYNKFYEYPM